MRCVKLVKKGKDISWSKAECLSKEKYICKLTCPQIKSEVILTNIPQKKKKSRIFPIKNKDVKRLRKRIRNI